MYVKILLTKKETTMANNAKHYKETIWYQKAENRKARAAEKAKADVAAKLERRKKYGERTVDKAFVECVSKVKRAFTTKMHPISYAGIPDRILHFNGRTCYVEMKTTGAECTPLQREVHKRLKELNIETYVLDTVITNIHDLYVYGYTTYRGVHYHKNPKYKKEKKV